MQIDFHHGTTYVIARFAGIDAGNAAKIAYAAQYVDDATNNGRITFDNGALYERMATAHRNVDLDNADDLKNRLVWLPFHFLPGNNNSASGKEGDGPFINKLICRPNSPIAKDMVASCIEAKGKPYGLHRLGITAHVLADTFAHQGFAGILHHVNDISQLKRKNGGWVEGALANGVPPLGHGQALHHPDQPWLQWSYENKYDKGHQERNNIDVFVGAANALHQLFKCWQKGAVDPAAPELAASQVALLVEMFEVDDDNEEACLSG